MNFDPSQRLKPIYSVNSALAEEDPSALLEQLTNEHAGVANIQEAQALHYLNLLKAMKAAKAEVDIGHVIGHMTCLLCIIIVALCSELATQMSNSLARRSRQPLTRLMHRP